MPHFCKPTTASVHYSQFLHRITIYCLRRNQTVITFNFRQFIKQVRHQSAWGILCEKNHPKTSEMI
ncbi:hypothetical protein HanXRQr2_Chr17g0782951 [Helianthus annuus]|uniref:Uncharacterized protein n=1 Tax=Helianthus annuus TaxID=4232 RepID=A0A251RMV9_HELAN|nr:hypothetical protein HanXRQr2_Chr17g0782951 [Helianthus annuus]